MNPSLVALMTKLNWQKNALTLELQKAEQDSQNLYEQINNLDRTVHQAYNSSMGIIPELEINRLNFITQQQERKGKFNSLFKNNQALEQKLRDKLLRINTELKMLEKYTNKETDQLKKEQHKIAEYQLEEWVLQKRELA